MAKGESPAAQSRRRGPGKHGIEMGKQNLAKGREAKRKATEAAHAAGQETARERWAKLLDGTLTVQDLDNEELARMRVRGADGGFSGARRPVPSHLAAAMQKEAMSRANEMFRTSVPKAVRRLLELAEDPDTKDENVIRAITLILDRGLGRTPETLRIEGASSFDKFLNEAGEIDLDRGRLDSQDEAKP